MTTHRYVSWVRFGVGATRTTGAPALNPALAATVTIAGTPTTVPLTLHGPGDIAALAGSTIVRRDPAPAALGVSPSGIPFVELSPADLPWRFSPPATPGTPATNLIPWLALIVVPASTPYGPKSGAPLFVIDTTRAELPDPREAWAWAHVQVEEPASGLASNAVGAFVRDNPTSAVARLLAPRHLEPRTKYRACLVPMYEAGRLAGLGKDPATSTAFAWDPTAPPATAVELPVYDSWLVDTGDIADFETLARRLRGRDADELFAPISVDVAAAANRTAPLVATTFGLLRPRDGETTLPEATTIAATLDPWLATDDAAAPVIGPPLYGAAQLHASSLTGAPAWQRELNLDPRRRAQAAAGAAIVRADQEQLVADARDAIGEVSRANAIVRGTQLAAVVAARIHKRHIASRPANRVVAMLWPNLAGTPAAATAAAPSPGATALLSASMRRMTRIAGPLARGAKGGVAWSRLNKDLSLAITEVPLATTSSVSLAGVRARVTTTTTTTSTTATHATTAATRVLASTRVADIHADLGTRLAHTAQVVKIPKPPVADANALATAALAAVAPIGIAKRAAARIEGLAVVSSIRDLVEIVPQPDLSRPLSDRLAQLRPELFAPGLADLPPDSVCVLTVDPAAIEAILAGANDELARELAWRDITYDRSITLLRQLWPRPARDPGGHYDVPPLAQWTGTLGANALVTPTVFIVRSELVRRFPDALYYCVRAVVNPTLGRKTGDEHVMPLFQGVAGPDIAYVGFAKSLAELTGDPAWKKGATTDPGYYFAIQERPGHTRFGLDAGSAPGAPSWLNLTWNEVVDATHGPYISLAHGPAGYTTPPVWGATAASMAAITERPAVRIAFHVDELLPRTET